VKCRRTGSCRRTKSVLKSTCGAVSASRFAYSDFYPSGPVLTGIFGGSFFMKRNKNLRVLVIAAFFAALSIALGKFLAISIGDTIRISFENLPLILASIGLGPLWGTMCAICADLLGCVLRGYGIIPLITLAQALMGLLPGLMTKYVFRSVKGSKVVLAVCISHLIASIIVKTVALHLTYTTPYGALFMTRVPTYIFIAAVESYLCVLLLKSKVLRKEFSL